MPEEGDEVGLGLEATDQPRQIVRVIGVEFATGAARNLRQGARAGVKHRGSSGHRLEHGQPEALVARGENEGQGAPIEIGQIRFVHVAEDANGTGREVGSFERGAIGRTAGAGHDESGNGPARTMEPAEGLDNEGEILVGAEVADRKQVGGLEIVAGERAFDARRAVRVEGAAGDTEGRDRGRDRKTAGECRIEFVAGESGVAEKYRSRLEAWKKAPPIDEPDVRLAGLGMPAPQEVMDDADGRDGKAEREQTLRREMHRRRKSSQGEAHPELLPGIERGAGKSFGFDPAFLYKLPRRGAENASAGEQPDAGDSGPEGDEFGQERLQGSADARAKRIGQRRSIDA